MLLGWRCRVQLVQSFFPCMHCVITCWDFEQSFSQKNIHLPYQMKSFSFCQNQSHQWQLTFNFRSLYTVLLLTTKRAHSRWWCPDVKAPNGADTSFPYKQETNAQKWQNSLYFPNQDYPRVLHRPKFACTPPEPRESSFIYYVHKHVP